MKREIVYTGARPFYPGDIEIVSDDQAGMSYGEKIRAILAKG